MLLATCASAEVEGETREHLRADDVLVVGEDDVDPVALRAALQERPCAGGGLERERAAD